MNLDDVSEEEIIKFMDEELANNLPALDKLHRDNPTLKEAWDQIKTIRALTTKKDTESAKKPWELAYFDILDGVEKNAALKEAWDKYHMLKNLMA